MKNIIIVLLAIVLLGAMPSAEWDKGTPEQKDSFAKDLLNSAMEHFSCSEGNLVVMGENEMVLFFFDCVKRKGGKNVSM